MPTISELEKWLTTGQAASRMGRTRQGVIWMAQNRKLRAAKTQLGWLIDPKSVDAAVASARNEKED